MWDLEFPKKRVHSVPLEFPEAGIQEAAGNLLPSSGERSGLWWESACHQHRDGVQSRDKTAVGRMGVESQEILPPKYLLFPRAHPSARAESSSVVRNRSTRS